MLPEKLDCKEFWSAIRESNVALLTKMCDGLVIPTFADGDGEGHMLCSAMNGKSATVEILKFFVDRGVDPAAMPAEGGDSPLSMAIQGGRLDFIEFLLQHGADPNADLMNQRITLVATHYEKAPSQQIEILKQLIDHGVDLNFVFSLYGDMEKGFTVLDTASKEGGVADFLRQHGAKTAKEVRASRPDDIVQSKSSNRVRISDEVVRHMESKFGPAEPRSFTDLLNAPEGISVHWIRAKSKDGIHTLFTTGLSDHRMPLPQGAVGSGYAEIYMQLPGSWDLLGGDGKYKWPVQLLSDLALVPVRQQAYFQIPITVISNGEPPELLHPSVPFTATALMGEEGFESSDGRIINLFCLLPVYQTEAELARRSIPEFLNLLDQCKVGRVLNPKRSSCL